MALGGSAVGAGVLGVLCVALDSRQQVAALLGFGSHTPPAEDSALADSAAMPAAVGTGGSRKPRSARWDNAKGILVTLVAIYHFTKPFPAATANVLFTSTYLMPAFCFVSGALSSTSVDERRCAAVWKLFISFLVNNVCFSVVLALTAAWRDGFGASSFDSAHLHPPAWANIATVPVFHLWYLFVLPLWRIIAVWWLRLRRPYLCALVVGVLAGYNHMVDQDSAATNGMRRLFTYFPHFIAGLCAKEDRWLDTLLEKAETVAARGASCGVMALVLALCVVLQDDVDVHWLKMNTSYKDSSASFGMEWWCGAIRLAVYAVQTVMIVATLSLVPSRRTFYTDLGMHTLTPYVMHIYVILIAGGLGLYQDLSSGWAVLLAVVWALLTVFFFSQGFWNKLYLLGVCLSPPIAWCLAPSTLAAAPPAVGGGGAHARSAQDEPYGTLSRESREESVPVSRTSVALPEVQPHA